MEPDSPLLVNQVEDRADARRFAPPARAHHPDKERLQTRTFHLKPMGPSRGAVAAGFLLFLLVGTGPQLMQNAVFAETAIFAHTIPEGHAVTGIIVTIFMIAQVWTLSYVLLDGCFKFSTKKAIFVTLLLSAANAVVLAFTWHIKAVVAGSERSVFIFACAFVAGGLGNSSTIFFFSFASQYVPLMTTAVSTGYSFSAVISSLLSIGQNAGDYTSLNFSVTVMFVICAGVLGLIIVSYLLIIGTSAGGNIRTPESRLQVTEARVPWKDFKGEAYAPLLFGLFLSMMTFFIPGTIPYMGGDEEVNEWLNNIFLVCPVVGSAITGVIPFNKTVYYCLTLLQFCCWTYILLPMFNPVAPSIPARFKHDWLLYVLMSVFCLLSGLLSTQTYLWVRDRFSKRPRVLEQVTSYVGALSQLGMAIGILLCDLLIGLDLLEVCTAN